MLQIKPLWFKSFNTLILTAGKSHSEKNASSTFNDGKQEARASSKLRMTHYPSHTLQNRLYHKPFYPLISEASQTRSLTMNSQAFTLREPRNRQPLEPARETGKEPMAFTWVCWRQRSRKECFASLGLCVPC